MSCMISSAQRLAYQQGELIIQLVENASIQSFSQELAIRNVGSLALQYSPIVRELNIWKLTYDFTKMHEGQFKAELFDHPQVREIQFNHFVKNRAKPNDPFFDEQWHHLNLLLNGNPEADLDSELAWNISTGGLSPLGDTIVIAIIDNGIESAHPDLEDQLWRNHDEIPNNGIDDDQNGYIDDYLGYNSIAEDDDIEGGSHGTSVAGIIGAKGDNALGVSGINWNTKLMIIRNNFNTTEANVLASYGYAYNARRRYNITNGKEGAFVVATNSSWGRDLGQAEDAPLWCSFYDELGKEGIVNCAATSNLEIDVDTEGDLPSSCSSPYLITVTNLNSFGEKVKNAGYGKETIDIGAFGDGVFTTVNQGYNLFSGTSAATPMVSGLVGLMYAAPCNNLSSFSRSNPQMAANFVVNYIRSGIKTNLSLQDITSTGGQLNLNNSISQMMDDCNECSLPSGIVTNAQIEKQQNFTWTAFNSSLAVNLQYKLKSEPIFNTVLNVEPPYTLNGLLPCAEYEFQLESICGDTTSSYTKIGFFKTKGCCENPSELFVDFVSTDQAIISWPSASLALGFEYRLKEINETTWSYVDTVSNNFIDLIDLTSCVEYELQVKVICDSEEEIFWTDAIKFKTLGCGLCVENNYCDAYGESTASEWIEQVDIHNYTLKSGNNDGYFAHQNEPIKLSVGGNYLFSILPGYANQALPEQVRVWLDIDQSGSFDVDELLFISPVVEESWMTRLQIPETNLVGQTQMRIMLSWVDSQSPGIDFDACSAVPFGEVEDICVDITSDVEPCTDIISDIQLLQSDMNSAILSWEALLASNEYLLEYSVEGDTSTQVLFSSQTPTIINGLESCVNYELLIYPVCNGLIGDSSLPFSFETTCDPLDATKEFFNLDYYVLQNPFYDKFSLSIPSSFQISSATLFSLNGQSKLDLTYTHHDRLFTVDHLASLPTGLYILQLFTSEGLLSFKVVKG